jgi:hypothetical protein
MFNPLTTMLSVLFTEGPTHEPTDEPVSEPKLAPRELTTLEAVNEKIAAFKAEIESREEQDRQLTKMLAEEAAKQERLRQAGADLTNVYKDLTRARSATEQKTEDVKAAAALTRAADRELFNLLQELESPSAPSVSSDLAAPPVPPPLRRCPTPESAASGAAVTTKVAPTTIGSPEAEPYLNISPFND